MLWVALGVLSIVLTTLRASGTGLGVMSGAFTISLGVWFLIRYRSAEVRARHVHHWTAKA